MNYDTEHFVQCEKRFLSFLKSEKFIYGALKDCGQIVLWCLFENIRNGRQPVSSRILTVEWIAEKADVAWIVKCKLI
jgi:hypothetical protein